MLQPKDVSTERDRPLKVGDTDVDLADGT